MSMFNTIKKLFKDYFFTGLLVVGPVAICFFFFKTIVNGTDSLLQTSQWAPLDIPGFGILLSLVIILFAGFLGRNYLGNYVFKRIASFAEKIPLFGGIYKSLQQVFETLFKGQEKHFSRVVIVPFPNAKLETLAFVTSESVPQEIQKYYQEPMLSVFIPNTPIPTTGFYLFVPLKDVKPTDISVEDAFKLVVSLGLVTPNGH